MKLGCGQGPPWLTPARDAARRTVSTFRRLSPQVREELVQDTLERLWAFGELRCPGNAAHVVAKRLAIDALRRSRAFEYPQGEAWCTVRVEERLDAGRALAALAGAPGRNGRTLWTLVVEDLEIDDLVAREEGPPDQVRSRLYKQRARARAWLAARLPELAEAA